MSEGNGSICTNKIILEGASDDLECDGNIFRCCSMYIEFLIFFGK